MVSRVCNGLGPTIRVSGLERGLPAVPFCRQQDLY
jgi:hypothetical protein